MAARAATLETKGPHLRPFLVGRLPELLVAGDPGDAPGKRSVPVRVEQRQGAEHWHADPGDERHAGRLHAGAGEASEVAEIHRVERPNGRGKPRPFACRRSVDRRRDAGAARDHQRRTAAERCRSRGRRNALPHGWAGGGTRRRSRPSTSHRTTIRFGSPSAVSAVTPRARLRAKPSPRTIRGCCATTRSVGVVAACAAVAASATAARDEHGEQPHAADATPGRMRIS